jgi:hypothetical protein
MKTKIIFLITLFLTGCYSFNNIQLPESSVAYKLSPKIIKDLIVEVKPISDDIVTHPTSVIVRREEKMASCDQYAMPDIPNMPELPIMELQQVGPNNPFELDRIQTQHISDLRAYITKIKQDLRVSYNEYTSRCYSSDAHNQTLENENAK